jgi:hypothetical protein
MKKLLFFVLSFSFATKLSAQVQMQTGSASFTLPMFNWNDDRSRLLASVALSYNSGNGLRVADVASNMGQGWSLVAGGFISRMVVGIPDDQEPVDNGGLNKYPPGYLYDPVSAELGCPNALAKYPLYGGRNTEYRQHNMVAADKEMDRFTFNINGRTGIFVVAKGGSDHMVFLNDTYLKGWGVRNVNHTADGIRTSIYTFYLYDENGLLYKFDQRETTTLLHYGYCDHQFKKVKKQPKFKKGSVAHEYAFDDASIIHPKVINSWYLSEIKDSLTQRKITFSYNRTSNIDAYSGNTITYYGGATLGNVTDKDYSIVSHARSKSSIPELTGITMPDGHQVTLTYGSNRLDLNGAAALSTIDILFNGRYLSRYKLNTTYFILNRLGTPTTDEQKAAARLCLRSVQRFGPDLKGYDQPYVFDYYKGTGDDDVVPPRFSPFKDIWGYYNGSSSRSYSDGIIDVTKSIFDLSNGELMGLCFLRSGGNGAVTLNAKPGYAKNGLLKEIRYPTGGTLIYEYAQNQAVINNVTVNAAGVRVSQTKIVDNGFSNDCSNPLVTNYSYVSNGGGPSLWGVQAPKRDMSAGSHYEPERKYFYCRGLSCGCDYSYKYPGILSRDQAVNLTEFQKALEGISKVMNIVSTISTVMNVIKLVSVGPQALVAVIIDVILTVVNIAVTCFSNPTKDSIIYMYYNFDLHSVNPLPSQFSRVEVTQSSGGNGKTVMEYTDPTDYALWTPTDNRVYSMKQRFAYWAYGLPKRTTFYDVGGFKTKEIENIYDWTNAKWPYINKVTDMFPNYKCQVVKSISQRHVDWEQPAFYNPPTGAYTTTPTTNIDLESYNLYHGRVELATTHERTFKPGSSSVALTTTTNYDYNTINYMVREIETIHSNGDKTYKNITYSCDHGGAPLAALVDANIKSMPVSTRTSIMKAGGALSYLSEVVTEYTTLSNGDIKKQRTLERRFAAPQPSAGFILYVGPGSTSNPTDYKQIELLTYDAAGNVIGMQDESGRVVTNVYDYTNKYIVASAVNAVPVADKVAYTSFETDSRGGWTVTGTSTFTAGGVTGARYGNLGAGISFSSTLNTAKAYFLSFWSQNALTVTGATLDKTGPSLGGFTYYEYKISAGTASVSISGTGGIDELRLYPQGSRMRTVTYDPIIGKTSESDDNNRLTFYEYEELGRLRFVKDQNRSIVKMYEYNTAVNRPNCVVTYGNAAISEVFYRNNCSAGFTGSKVTYTIPANKYTSTDPDLPDLLAQKELDDLAQGYANTNGTCIPLYSNVAKSQSFTKEVCGFGTTGSTVTYSVPAGRYTSTISQAAADEMAQDEIDANGQWHANLTGTCIGTTTAQWEGTGLTECRSGNRFAQLKDMNPSSSTYNQVRWEDFGADATCPPYSIGSTTSCPNTHTQYTLSGVAGDVVVLKVRFNGFFTGVNPNSFGSGAVTSIAAGGQSNSASSPRTYTTSTNPTGFDISCNITFTMTSSTVSVVTTAVINNTGLSRSGNVTLEVVSVNGVAPGVTKNGCFNVSTGAW